jgi:hypothetical protein
MKNSMLLFSLALVGTCLGGCAKENLDAVANETPGFATDRAPAVPFKASYQIQPEVEAIALPILTLAMPGAGHGTQLGKSTFSADSWADLSVVPFLHNGVMTLTAADGSTLSGTFSGIALPSIDDEGHHHAILEGTYSITEGTGRFENATGNGAYTGRLELADLVPGTVGEGELSLDGTLYNP